MSDLPPIKIDTKTFLYDHCAMPALPEVLTSVQQVMQSEDASIDKVAQIISHDPALVAQILKVVNSAYYSLPKEIAEVKMAIAFLGINEVYRIILTLSAINALAINDKQEFDRIWLHSLYAALCTKFLAHKYEPYLSPGELWTAALLHDIGKLVYLKFFADHYRAIKTYSLEQGVLFSDAERHFDLPTSAYMGALLCDRWRLPVRVRGACEKHSLEDLARLNESDEEDPFNRMIILGNLMAVLTQDGLNQEKKELMTEAIKTELKLSDSDFLMVIGELSELRVEADRMLIELN